MRKIGRLLEAAVQSFLGLMTLLIFVSGIVFFIIGVAISISKGH